MKIIGICGSPRKKSSSSHLVKTIVDSASENGHNGIVYEIRNLNIDPCKACDYCEEGKGCKLDDAMTDIYDEIYDSDIIVVGSPIYYGEVSSQTKKLIDRLYQFTMNPNQSLKDKKVIQIYTQGEKDSDIYKTYFDYQKQFTYGVHGMSVIARIIAAGIMTLDDLIENEVYIQEAEPIGKNI